MQIQWLGSPNYTSWRPGPPQYIVDHWTVSTGHSAEVHFLDPNAKVSAHYLVKRDGSIDQFVDEQFTAWHSGGEMYNYLGIGIEHEHFDELDAPGIQQDWPEAQLFASAELHRDISARWGIPLIHRSDGQPGVLGHRETGYATQCPGDLPFERILSPADTTVLGRTAGFLDPSGKAAWAATYRQEAPWAGIRGELAFAQALKETDYFNFTGIAKPEWNNPAGLGATGEADTGNRFPDQRSGVIAHLQHLLMYFTLDHTPYCTPLLDQRHGNHRGLPNDVRELNGRWAVPGNGYGEAIASLAAHITDEGNDVAFTNDPDAQAFKNDVNNSIIAIKNALENLGARIDALGGVSVSPPNTLEQIAATQPPPPGFRWLGTRLVAI